MARVYTGTRLMLDPSLAMAARRASAESEAEARSIRGDIAKGIGAIGGSIGQAIDYAGERKAQNLRREMMQNAPDMGDPEYQAAVERFVSTGDIGGLNAYRQMKEARERMAKEAKLREKELGIRKAETLAMKKQSEAELSKERNKQIKLAENDFNIAKNDYDTQSGAGNKNNAILRMEKALIELDSLGVDTSKYAVPEMIGGKRKVKPKTEDSEEEIVENVESEIVDQNTLDEAKADLRIRLDEAKRNKRWGRTEDRKQFVEDVQRLRETPFGAEDKELVQMMNEASGYKSKHEIDEANKERRKKMARLYAKKMEDNVEFSEWFNKTLKKDHEKLDEYQEAYNEFKDEL